MWDGVQYRTVYLVERKSDKTGNRLKPKVYFRKPTQLCYHYVVMADTKEEAIEQALFLHEQKFQLGRVYLGPKY